MGAALSHAVNPLGGAEDGVGELSSDSEGGDVLGPPNAAARGPAPEMSAGALAEAVRAAMGPGRAAGRVVALTGAGVSAESGMPTFRDPSDGLWERHSMDLCASLDGFRSSPSALWGLVAGLHAQGAPEPNAAHRALAELERRGVVARVVTQNVDGLHSAAGSRAVTEYHGSLARARCEACGDTAEMGAVLRPLLDEARAAGGGGGGGGGGGAAEPPRCRACGGIMRPAAALYGEALDAAAAREASAAVRDASVLLVVGTSARVRPAADLVAEARRCGARVYEVNTERTHLTRQGLSHGITVGRAGEVLPRLADALAAASPAPG